MPQQKHSTDHHGWLATETVKTRFGDFDFNGGYPTTASCAALLDQLKFNRAIEVYLAQMPAVAIYESCEGFRNFITAMRLACRAGAIRTTGAISPAAGLAI